MHRSPELMELRVCQEKKYQTQLPQSRAVRTVLSHCRAQGTEVFSEFQKGEMKYIRRKQPKGTATIKAGKSPHVRACQEHKVSLKPEELEKSTFTSSSETRPLVDTPCVWNLSEYWY
ncbi:hypothetical protein MC885_021008 [Smutsia gigantea]|nr:hypothetical protein MC885_021008 [Smutsia gigantea]